MDDAEREHKMHELNRIANLSLVQQLSIINRATRLRREELIAIMKKTKEEADERLRTDGTLQVDDGCLSSSSDLHSDHLPLQTHSG